METVQIKNAVLDKDSISRKLRRMALQVAEQNSEERELVIAGITGNGEVVARSLVAELNKISPFATRIITIQLNKKMPSEITVEPLVDLKDKVVILVDDVANTGRTMFYALKPFLDTHPKKIQTLVLVERSHKLFPIQTDYAGLSLATTLQEHIMVEADKEEIIGAWLF
ncbi:MAG TPA: phosphoribosyltransferase family protein [Flavisolibacter sp.]|nr:phosphoribosyltransferase family protein [Flavisolibacter sp.]